MPRNIRLLYLHSFLTDFRLDGPYQVIFFAQVVGSYTIAMSVVALERLSAALFDIPTGVMSDRIGRRRTIALGSLALALGIGLYASAQGGWALYSGAILSGLSRCLFSGNNNALLFETLKAEEQQNRFAHYNAGIGMMFQSALCLSAFTAIPLAAHGLRLVFLLAIAPQILAAFVSLLFSEPRVHLVGPQKNLALLKQAWLAMVRNPRLVPLLMARSIGYGAGESTFQFQTTFINQVWPVWAVGLYRGLNHAASFISFRLARYMVAKVKPYRIFLLNNVYDAVSSFLALILHNLVSPLLLISTSFFYGPGEVASESLIQHEFSDDQRATMGSLASSANSVMFAVVALLVGAVADRWGIRVGVGLGVGLGLLSLPIYHRLFRREA